MPRLFEKIFYNKNPIEFDNNSIDMQHYKNNEGFELFEKLFKIFCR